MESEKAKNSLKRMDDILEKIKSLLYENEASIGKSEIYTEFTGDTPYSANITIHLR